MTAGQRPRILIVEDQAVTAADLRDSLETLGYHIVATVDTGSKAVRVARESSPDVVLMDIRLRGSMDGIAAADEIRKQWNVPVVFVTATADEDVLQRASVAGAYGYLLKPFRPNELNAAILVAMQRHRLARELFTEQTWLRTVLESLSDAVIATDGEGRVRYMNAAAEALLGVCFAQVGGQPIEDVARLTTVSNQPIEAPPLRHALRTNSAVEKGRFLMRSWDGRVVPVENSASPIQASGAVIGAVSVIVDITERIRRERELELERERLAEEVQTTAEALGHTRTELRALADHLMTAQEDERRRVARELHDDLSQRAAVADIDLQGLAALLPHDDEKGRQILMSVRQKIGELSTVLREISHRLHPAAVEDLGLGPALRALVTDYCESGVDATLVARSHSLDLPLNVATALYRIAQEALRNAAKHAKGAPVKVVLERYEGEVLLRIEDDGPGFDLSRVRGKGGLGLLSMQERARLVGGMFMLHCIPGDGAVVTVRVPLPVSGNGGKVAPA